MKSDSNKVRKKICLFGTSANPPTGQQGHGGIVRALSDLCMSTISEGTSSKISEKGDEGCLPLCFDEIRVVPVYRHMYAIKRKQLAPFEHRLQMCSLAFQGIPNVTISDAECHIYQAKLNKIQLESQQSSGSNGNNNNGEDPTNAIRVGTADLLEYFVEQDRLANNESNQYTLCLGADTFLDLTSGKWRRTQEILDLIQGRFVVLYRATHDDDENDDENDSEPDNNVDNSNGDNGDNGNNNGNNRQAQNIEQQHAALQEAIADLEETYGPDAIQLLHVPTLGAVSSTLVRSLSSELSLASRGGTSSNASASRHSNSLSIAAEEDETQTTTPLPTVVSGEQQQQQQQQTVTTQQQQALEKRMKRMVDDKVLEYMREHELYEFEVDAQGGN